VAEDRIAAIRERLAAWERNTDIEYEYPFEQLAEDAPADLALLLGELDAIEAHLAADRANLREEYRDMPLPDLVKTALEMREAEIDKGWAFASAEERAAQRERAEATAIIEGLRTEVAQLSRSLHHAAMTGMVARRALKEIVVEYDRGCRGQDERWVGYARAALAWKLGDDIPGEKCEQPKVRLSERRGRIPASMYMEPCGMCAGCRLRAALAAESAAPRPSHHDPVRDADDFAAAESNRDLADEVVHMAPSVNKAVTPCCGRTPFELRATDRMTLDQSSVTCRGAASPEEAQP
jgi:hypothetical protein